MISKEKWKELTSIDDKTRTALLELKGEAHVKAFDRLRVLLYELVRLNYESDTWAKDNGYSSFEDYPHYTRSREIAKAIHKIAGFGGLQSSLTSVQRMTTLVDESVDNFSLIEYGWRDIGGWQS